jgi:hypothetical protein
MGHIMTAEQPAPDESKIGLPCPRPMILEYLSLSGTRERIEVRPLLSTKGWHDRRRRTFWPSDEGPALVLSRDDRWITFPIDLRLDPSQSEQASPTSARELSGSEAMDWLAAHGFDVPRRLQGRAPTGGRDATGELTPERLTATMRSILTALKDLEAFSLTSARSQAEVIEKAGLSSLYTRTVQEARVKLKEEGLLDTQAGINGGTWITSRGLEFLSH